MRYLIKQKLFSLGDGFTIKDEAGNDCFKVKSKLIAMGNKLYLNGMDGRELCFIEQKLLKLTPEYHVSINSQEVMTVKQKMTLFTKNFIIKGLVGEYKIDGNLIAKDFRITQNGVIKATISKKFVSLSDTYTVDIDNNENPVLMLATAIILDMVCHNN